MLHTATQQPPQATTPQTVARALLCPNPMHEPPANRKRLVMGFYHGPRSGEAAAVAERTR